MAYWYFDDSKHHRWGFSLGTYVICECDPEPDLVRAFDECGLDPKKLEFKSSVPMKDNPKFQRLRQALRDFVEWKCKVAVCVVDGDKNLGPAGLKLLRRALPHPMFVGHSHQVYFDEGLFLSKKSAMKTAKDVGGHVGCEIHFEQDSKSVIGIQLADLVAHTCGTMLLDALGKKMKLVQVGDSGCDADVEIDLGFELWAGLRYAFLSVQKTDPTDKFDLACVDVSSYGLFIDNSARTDVAAAAVNRFSDMYLGCIH